MKRNVIFIFFALCGLVLSLSTNALAIDPYTGEGNPILGANVVVTTTGDVTATFLYGSGSYDDYLYLASPSNPYQNANPNSIGSNWIFENHSSSAGNTVDLGTFTAGTVLEFNVLADTHGGGYLNWYTGPASLNADGFVHAWVDSAYTGPYGGTAVGFEDLSGANGNSSVNNGILGPGDAGYEDLAYSFTNVQAVPTGTPEPATMFLYGLGLLGIAGWRLRKRS